jgi:hypothetical protein
MKSLTLARSLTFALAFSALASPAAAQNAPARGADAAPAASAWPSVTDFAARGPFAITRETNVGPNASYDIVRPVRLGEEGRKHPIVSWNNGTLYQIDRYQDLLDHWASHGFVVMGAHTNRTRGGAVHEAAIDWLVAENARAGSAYFGMLDLTKIGASGHSQGGGATITAGAGVPGPMENRHHHAAHADLGLRACPPRAARGADADRKRHRGRTGQRDRRSGARRGRDRARRRAVRRRFTRTPCTPESTARPSPGSATSSWGTRTRRPSSIRRGLAACAATAPGGGCATVTLRPERFRRRRGSGTSTGPICAWVRPGAMETMQRVGCCALTRDPAMAYA